MRNPISTYRIQFHKDFTFTDFERIIPYLDKLGIKTVYASPIFEAVPGSVHGYDGVNPQRINPEIGTDEQLRHIHQALAQRGIDWLQDIVPNHMAFHPANGWLMDVLEKGPLSIYSTFFDIDWDSPHHHGRLMVPFLGEPLDEVLRKGELTVAYQNQRFVLAYFDTNYPIHLRSYATILQAADEAPSELLQEWIAQVSELEGITDPTTYALHSTALQVKLAEWSRQPATKSYLNKCLNTINKSPDQLKRIANEQVYRLCSYGETDARINYRRFFTVNSLICLNIQHQNVFDHVHRYTKNLLETGVFQGLRVDHIDGLYDPSQYLERLRQLSGDDAYLIVEKILKDDEDLPANWPIQGATGYGFLSIVNNLLTRTSSQQSFTRFYQELVGERQVVRQELYDKKAYILFQHMGGELDNLFHLFSELQLASEEQLAGLPDNTLKEAIGEFLIQCPVYRYYGNQMPLDSSEADAVRSIFDRIRTSKSRLASAIDLLEDVLLTRPKAGNSSYNDHALRFYQRCMQFTGPLMAKGVEDTLMYTYTRFIGHDEVGDSPLYFGLTVDEFHQKMIDRRAKWPLALNATSTHDTKRGEDVRSRLNVLTDLADEWIDEVRIWQTLNRPLKSSVAINGPESSEEEATFIDSPDPNDEYFIYQTLVGAYPMPDQDGEDFPNRLNEYLEKALREAKRYSSHDTPNTAYEDATKAFAHELLDTNRPFWKRFDTFYRQITDLGIINSLIQVVLKCTCPGLPDVYQGCEGWDLSMVDPDNRRPVDFEQRCQALDTLLEYDPDWQDLWKSRYDGQIKLRLIYTLLQERQQQPMLFAEGHYTPLRIEGRYKEQVLAFARHDTQQWYVIAIPLGIAQLCRDQQTSPVSIDWDDTHILLPDETPKRWEHRLTKARGRLEAQISVADVFSELPLGLISLTT
ncbi:MULTISPECIES: malto-oligosyltrehalose synthase [unclassified Spirosoma]|uniref:malto-oligosyltrehalose synthase n=1 Tax=unclassified Spirosoma TaxID=2621999 RepID=UPI0009642CE9|nr:MULTISPECIES: malto-oligosyltrehalose synthase [unclassified Spirosoma]MBN8821241.1 malto-oligosyltrehalose synthase [Spirosoma sp.]OJW79133.1 MAG: malto-oligosyltrehalose synthase [Spirosoma sp. 48-14]